MYQFSKNLKLTAFGLIIVGLLGIGYGFYSAPSTVEEAKAFEPVVVIPMAGNKLSI